MNVWEYLTVQLRPRENGKVLGRTIIVWDPNYFTEQLNYYGSQGWELVSCFDTESQTTGGNGGGTNGLFATFKRVKG
jgi:hypothetical protein